VKIIPFLLILTTSIVSSTAYSRDLNQELTFGSVAMDIPAEMHKRLKPLTQYLSKQLQRHVNLRLSPNMGAAITSAINGNVDLTYLTPVAYIKAKAKSDVKLLVKTVTNNKASFQLMIATKQNNNINTINDLVGKRFAFGDKRALLQRAAVVGSGIKPEQFSEIKFLGHYDNIARAVSNGDFDAGILKDTTAYQWQGRGLKILYRSPNLPPYNITASKNLKPALFKKLQQAFLNLNSNTPEHLKIIKALDPKYNGFAITNDAEYDVVRKLIAPFNASK